VANVSRNWRPHNEFSAGLGAVARKVTRVCGAQLSENMRCAVLRKSLTQTGHASFVSGGPLVIFDVVAWGLGPRGRRFGGVGSPHAALVRHFASELTQFDLPVEQRKAKTPVRLQADLGGATSG